MRSLMLSLLVASFSFGNFAFAADDKYEPDAIKKGFEVNILEYTPGTDSFLLEIVSEPSVGPNYATPEDFAKAIDYKGSKAAFIKEFRKMKGTITHLDHDLRLLSEEEMTRREKNAAKSH